jgi:hypothetical protein
MAISPDLLRAARETYALEMMLNSGLSTDALEKAISSGLDAHERAVLYRVANEAESFAIGMEAEGETSDYAMALRWFASKLRTDFGLPAEPIQPQHEDVVEITITGMVTAWEDTCDNSGCSHHDYEWSVLDDATGDEYFFRAPPNRAPRVRVLSKNTTEGDQ